MSDGAAGLGAEAVDFLLELLELREPRLSGAAAELRPDPARRLMAAGLMVPQDHEAGSASLADHDDVPVSLIWSEQHAALAYFSPAVGLVPVPHDRLVRHRADVEAVLAAATARMDLPRGRAPHALVEGLLWEIGEVRLGRRPARVPLWFARRLVDSAVVQQVVGAARARPHNRLRVILTSARPSRVAEIEIPGAAVVALRDVLAAPDDLAISPDILDARLRGVPAEQDGRPLVLSSDGRQLRIGTQPPIAFTSDAHIAAIRKLVDAYYRGERLPIRELTDLGSPARLFGGKKWALLKPHITTVNGLWGFDL